MAIVTEFDAPIFKVLANNDTGAATGHQGGFVLPKDLEDYFPLLRNITTVDRPTVDVEITAELFDGATYLGTAETRYQYQTWGGARSPERRITRNLSVLLNGARGGDLLLIERGISVDTHYRFRLIKHSNPLYAETLKSVGTLRWGVLDPNEVPAKETDVEQVVSQIEDLASNPFQMFEDSPAINETRRTSVARSRAFKRSVSRAYGQACSFCTGGLIHPDGRSENDAAHVVSRSLCGTDDVRNGILLCKAHHWAFDAGLVGVSDDYRIIVPSVVRAIQRNHSLQQLEQREIRLPLKNQEWPAKEALAWHRSNVMVRM